MKKRRISLIILLLLLSAVCLASLTMAWKEYADQASDCHAFDELAELVEKPEEMTVPATETESTDTTEDTTEKLSMPKPSRSQPSRSETLLPSWSRTANASGGSISKARR